MPWPANGGIRWAASPASSTLPAAPPLGVAGAERVDGVALERGVLPASRPTPASSFHAASTSLRSSSVLVGEPHELPPPPARAARHHRRRPGGVAHLHVDRVVDARLVQHDVDDQPVVEEAEVGRRDVEQPRAPCCWRRRTRRRTGSAPRRRLRRDRARRSSLRRRPGRSRPPRCPRRTVIVGSSRGPRLEQRFERRLVEHRRRRPPVAAQSRRCRTGRAACRWRCATRRRRPVR